MNTKTFALALVMGSLLVGCKDKAGDSGETGGGGDGTDGTDGADGGTDGGSQIDSCDWGDVGLCFEFTDYANAETWCAEIGAEYGFATTFYPGDGCPSGGEGPCSLPAGGDFEVPSEAYYYEGGGEAACAEAGGTWNG